MRPFNRREAAMQAGCVVEMRGDQTILRADFTKDGESKPFTFDESIWSHDPVRPRARARPPRPRPRPGLHPRPRSPRKQILARVLRHST